MRLLDLPPSLLVWTTILLTSASRVTAQFTNSSTTGVASTSDGGVGSYIISGLGGAASGTANATLTAFATATGAGFDYASSCNAASYAYSSASSAYGNDHYFNVTNTTTFAYTYTTSSAPASTHATSLTTLCDGHARVVGRTTVHKASSRVLTSATTYPVTHSIAATDYPTPSPACSIGTSDCSLLWAAYSASISSIATQTGGYYDRPPLCNTNTAIPTSTGTCSYCQIVAESARLLYWPVTTVPGSGDLCNKTAQTITKTHVGPPSSFVTSGLTITSPTVALSFGGLGRIDDCGAKTDTIVAVNPDEVATVRGYRIYFSHWQFNYADLNYNCASNSSGNSTIPDWDRDDCYQAVPADAYFAGLQEASKNWMNGSDGLTIWPDYHPQVLVPATMLPAISSIWGKDCEVNPLGVWDPPVALTQESEVDGVTTPAHNPATTTSEDPGFSATPAKLDSQTTVDGPTKPTQSATISSAVSQTTAAYPQVASTQTKLSGTGDDLGSTTSIIPAPSPAMALTRTKLSAPGGDSTGLETTSLAYSPAIASMATKLSGAGEGSADPKTTSLVYSPAIASTATKLVGAGGGSAGTGTTTVANANNGGAAGILASILGGSTLHDNAQQASQVQDPAQASQGPAGAVLSILEGGDGGQTAFGGANGQHTQAGSNPAAGGAGSNSNGGGLQTTGVWGTGAASINQDPASAPFTQAIVLGTQTIVVTRPASSPDVAIIAGVTLSQGGNAVTISGHSITMGSGGVVLVDGVTASAVGLSGQSSTGPTNQVPASAPLTQAVVLGTQTTAVIRPASSPDVAIIAGVTLSQGGNAVTISGHSITVGSSGVVLVDGVTALAATFSRQTSPQPSGSPGPTTTGRNSESLSGLPTISRVSGSQIASASSSLSDSAGASASGTTNSGGRISQWSALGASATIAAVMAFIMI